MKGRLSLWEMMGCPMRFMELPLTHPGKRFAPEREMQDDMITPNLVFPILADRGMIILTYLIKLS